MSIRILLGDAREKLHDLPDNSVHCVVTSPPYYGLRDYGVDGQIGLESSPEEFIDALVGIFRSVRRVLRCDGTCWLNIGDSYSNVGPRRYVRGERKKRPIDSAKPKDLLGIPWMLAFALREDGWYLRQDIIWHKPNPMPESVTDRCTKAHEYVEPCILAGCPVGGTVLDPFGGAGTTAIVAQRLERSAILVELNPSYVEMAKRRIGAQTLPLPFDGGVV